MPKASPGPNPATPKSSARALLGSPDSLLVPPVPPGPLVPPNAPLPTSPTYQSRPLRFAVPTVCLRRRRRKHPLDVANLRSRPCKWHVDVANAQGTGAARASVLGSRLADADERLGRSNDGQRRLCGQKLTGDTADVLGRHGVDGAYGVVDAP
jgi:hypothetical protein